MEIKDYEGKGERASRKRRKRKQANGKQSDVVSGALIHLLVSHTASYMSSA